ncbi:MAG: hypothetical protein ACTSRB_00475 [Candidatus Helarchaeota archaeon]
MPQCGRCGRNFEAEQVIQCQNCGTPLCTSCYYAYGSYCAYCYPQGEIAPQTATEITSDHGHDVSQEAQAVYYQEQTPMEYDQNQAEQYQGHYQEYPTAEHSNLEQSYDYQEQDMTREEEAYSGGSSVDSMLDQLNALVKGPKKEPAAVEPNSAEILKQRIPPETETQPSTQSPIAENEEYIPTWKALDTETETGSPESQVARQFQVPKSQSDIDGYESTAAWLEAQQGNVEEQELLKPRRAGMSQVDVKEFSPRDAVQDYIPEDLHPATQTRRKIPDAEYRSTAEWLDAEQGSAPETVVGSTTRKRVIQDEVKEFSATQTRRKIPGTEYRSTAEWLDAEQGSAPETVVGSTTRKRVIQDEVKEF